MDALLLVYFFGVVDQYEARSEWMLVEHPRGVLCYAHADWVVAEVPLKEGDEVFVWKCALVEETQ
tara:strand:+ start:373 stop:567 length:195 start_codon:yes stop_codon:yes gene_type:complete